MQCRLPVKTAWYAHVDCVAKISECLLTCSDIAQIPMSVSALVTTGQDDDRIEQARITQSFSPEYDVICLHCKIK